MPENCAGTDCWDEARKPRGRGRAETPLNEAKFTMAHNCALPRFHGALIDTYNRLILGVNLAVSDFHEVLLHACTGLRYEFRRKSG